jgi:hypothetical protein
VWGSGRLGRVTLWVVVVLLCFALGHSEFELLLLLLPAAVPWSKLLVHS